MSCLALSELPAAERVITARRVGIMIAVSVPSRITDAEADTLIAQLQAARAYPAREVV